MKYSIMTNNTVNRNDALFHHDNKKWFVLVLVFTCCCVLSVAVYSVIVLVDRNQFISRVEHLFLGPTQKLFNDYRLCQVKSINGQEIFVFPYTYRKQPLPTTAQEVIKQVERSMNDPAYKARLINYEYNPYGPVYNEEIENQLSNWEDSFSPLVGITPYNTKYFDVWLFYGSRGSYNLDYYSSKGAILDNNEDVLKPSLLYDRALNQIVKSYTEGYFNTDPQYLDTDKIIASRYYVLSHIQHEIETDNIRPTNTKGTSSEDYSTVFLSYSHSVFDVMPKEKERHRLLIICILSGIVLPGLIGGIYLKTQRQR